MLNYMIFFLAGILTKMADDIADKKILHEAYAFLLSVVAGMAFAYLFSLSTTFSTLILAVICSLLFAGKLDHLTHQVTLGSFLVGIFVFGLSPINFIAFPVLFLASFFDEYFHERIKNRFFRHRMLLELTCLALSIAIMDPAYFVSIFGFDVGYVSAGFLNQD